MVSGKQISDHIVHIELNEDEDITQENTFVEETQEVQGKEVNDDKPVLQEVTILSDANSKNPSGSKKWVCKHCKQQFTSSYTRIHVHFFGAMSGKKP